MIYVWHKEKLDQSQVSKLKAFDEWREEMSGQSEQCRILSHVHPPIPDRH